MSETPIRLAIIGCGFAAQQIHIPRLLKMANAYTILGVADVRPEAAAQAAVLAGDCLAFTDLDEMLDQTHPDGLVVLTPLHSEPVEKALRRGIDVFVEKPLCESPAEAQRLVKLAREMDRVMMVGAMRVFDPAIDHAKKIVTEISPVRWVEIRDFCGAGSVTAGGDLIASQFQRGLSVPDGYQKNLLQSLLLEFIHDISILRAIFGSALHTRAAQTAPDGWSTTGQLVLPGDVPCVFAFSEFGVTSAAVFDVSLRFFGEKGCAEIRFGDPNQDGHGVTTISRDFGTAVSLISDVFTDEWLAFSNAIRTRQAVINTAEDGAADLALAWQIFESCLTNQA